MSVDAKIKRDLYLNVCTFVLLAGCAFLIYSNTLNSPFLFDGIDFIQKNSEIKDIGRALSFFKTPNRPLTNFSYALNYKYSALGTTSYHVVNIAIHILCSFFVFFFTKLTVERVEKSRKLATMAAVFASLLFLAHPIQTESVTYIYQRATCLSAMFYMMSIVSYIKFRISQGGGLKCFFIVSVILTALLGFISKGNAYLLLLFIPLYELFFFRKFSGKTISITLLSMVPAGLTMFSFLIMVKGWKVFEIFAIRFEARGFTMMERLLTESRIVVFYLSQLVYPHPSRLSLAHDVELSTSLFSPFTTILSIIFIVALIAGAVFFAPKFKILSFGIIWYFGNQILESTVFPLELVFEHRNYLPSVGIFMILAYLAVKFIFLLKEKFKERKSKVINFLFFIPFLCIIVLSIWTYQRNQVWATEISIWKDAANKSPNSSRAFNGLGDAYLKEGKLDEAALALSRSVAIDGENFRAQNNLGTIYGQKGDYRKAITYFKKAIEIRPNHSPPYTNTGNCYYLVGNFDQAIYYYRQALELDKNNQEAIYNLVNSLIMTKQFGEAKELSQYLVRSHPENSSFRGQLGEIEKYMGSLE